MDASEFSKKITESGVVVLDVRTPEEFFEGYIEGARNIDFYHADFENEITSLEKEHTYAVYCRSGKRSGLAIKIMHDAGFQNLYNLDGGIIDWAMVGNPLINK